jgi:hypothetical protein
LQGIKVLANSPADRFETCCAVPTLYILSHEYVYQTSNKNSASHAVQVLEDHVGIGEIQLRADPDADTSNMKEKEPKAYEKAVAVAEQVTFWATMPQFGISMGNKACTLWSMRKHIGGGRVFPAETHWRGAGFPTTARLVKM